MTHPLQRDGVRSARRGTALVAALALVVLAAALLASAALVASSGAATALRARASLAAESGVRRALADGLISWNPAWDSLGTGAALAVDPASVNDDSGAGLPMLVTIRAQRLAPTLYALTADVRVGGEPLLARRRASIVVQRSGLAAPGVALSTLAPIVRWSTADLY